MVVAVAACGGKQGCRVDIRGNMKSQYIGSQEPQYYVNVTNPTDENHFGKKENACP